MEIDIQPNQIEEIVLSSDDTGETTHVAARNDEASTTENAFVKEKRKVLRTRGDRSRKAGKPDSKPSSESDSSDVNVTPVKRRKRVVKIYTCDEDSVEEKSECQKSPERKRKVTCKSTTLESDRDSGLGTFRGKEANLSMCHVVSDSQPAKATCNIENLQNGEDKIPDEQQNEENRRDSASQSSSETSSTTTSSESLSDAQNPLNIINFKKGISSSPSPLEVDTIDRKLVPIVRICSKVKRVVEVLIYSGDEFSVEIYQHHHQTGKRIQQYPQDFARDVLALPASTRRYENNKFIFKSSLTIFQRVKQIILKNWRNVELSGLEVVIQALDKYRHVMDQDLLHQIDFECQELRIDKIPDIKPYQKKSISFAYLRQGRCMLADSSGMGKRVEAIIICSLFEGDWPVIIICSTSQQQNWISQLNRWLPSERRHKFLSLQNKDDCVEYMKLSQPELPDFTVIGYSLLKDEAKQLKRFSFRFLIIDESHKIKHAWTATAKSTRHIIKRAKRRLLLTSNPAFGVPEELFCQLHVIDRKSFKDAKKFADRYCGFESRYDKRTDRVLEVSSRNWRNAKNLEELKYLLHNTVMIRHYKTSVDENSSVLPNKMREVVKLDFQPDERTRKILGEMYNQSKDSLDDLLMEADSRKAKVFVWFKKSGRAKLGLICKYLDQLDMKGKKIIIYARHLFVIQGIMQLFDKKRIGYVRITGTYEARMEQSDEFNNNPKVSVAILSLSISQVGVNLTKADTIIFTELYWVPDSILRNEDRAWEFFQSDSRRIKKKTLEIKYLIACERNANDYDQVHIDLHLWEMLQGKIHVLKKLDLIRDNFTTDIPEVHFEAIESDIIDDLKFSDLSSNESDHEYDPAADESESSSTSTDLEDISEIERSNSSARTNSDNSGPSSDKSSSSISSYSEKDEDPEELLMQKITSETESLTVQVNSTHEGSDAESGLEDKENNNKVGSRRITRSMSKSQQENEDSEKEPESESGEDHEVDSENFVANSTDSCERRSITTKEKQRNRNLRSRSQRKKSRSSSQSDSSSSSEMDSTETEGSEDSEAFEMEKKRKALQFLR